MAVWTTLCSVRNGVIHKKATPCKVAVRAKKMHWSISCHISRPGVPGIEAKYFLTNLLSLWKWKLVENIQVGKRGKRIFWTKGKPTQSAWRLKYERVSKSGRNLCSAFCQPNSKPNSINTGARLDLHDMFRDSCCGQEVLLKAWAHAKSNQQWLNGKRDAKWVFSRLRRMGFFSSRGNAPIYFLGLLSTHGLDKNSISSMCEKYPNCGGMTFEEDLDSNMTRWRYRYCNRNFPFMSIWMRVFFLRPARFPLWELRTED